jgi:GMP synthase (glutamine-hydrolysing)
MFDLDKIVVLDFGAQYSQLIARRVREAGVYCEIWPFTDHAKAVSDPSVKAVILSGGPSSVFEKGAPTIDAALLTCGKPVLGICYGMQLMSHLLGGEVISSQVKEYGDAYVEVKDKSAALFKDLPSRLKIWMSHGDVVRRPPAGFTVTAESENGLCAAMTDPARKLCGVQFHPEVTHSEKGREILANFIFGVAGMTKNWDMKKFIEEKTRELREVTAGKTVVTAVSGGVDSTVMAVFLNKVLGDRLHCIFVDNGVLRKNEAREVLDNLARLGVKIDFADAADLFLKRLKGIAQPEKKRKIIGETFLKVFLNKAGRMDFLAQGTLYPDVIESVSVKGPSATIKTHHNRVKGVLKLMSQGKIIEPFRELFKDEVRAIGTELGVPDDTVWRQPFPGPGLAVRILGDITPARLSVLREADAILQEELKKTPFYRTIWQSFAVLLPVRSVGVMGDQRTYENAVALRVVESQDGMTASWKELPDAVLRRISARIVNEVKGVNRVVYDVTSKPPATIEWE